MPTIWEKEFNINLLAYFDELHTDEVVIKPTVGTGGFDTFRVTKQNAAAQSAKLAAVFNH